VPPAALIDTGAILALVDRSDDGHAAWVAAHNGSRLPLLTTQVVLAEVFHLTRGHRRQMASVWTLLRSGAIQMSPISHHELFQVQTLMDDYADCPTGLCRRHACPPCPA
jgi:predicted nucleic acid-binding protein